uniref:Col_cuticle_N domain-containing protein n=1 Tax=Heterorhabditis bacteriophora TaxID=37862 RepID=A0A1I7W8N0_HETBA
MSFTNVSLYLEKYFIVLPSSETDCAISRSGLFAVAGGLGTICATLFVIALAMFIKLNRNAG